MHCFQNKPQSSLKLPQSKHNGFLCPACYTSGYTFRTLCVHLMNVHSSEDLVKMGVSTIHVARGAGGLLKSSSEAAYQLCVDYIVEQKRLIGRTSRTLPTPPISRAEASVPQATLPPPNVIELRTRMLGSDLPLVDLMRA